MGASVSLRLSSSTQNGIEPSEASNLRPVTLAELQATETRISGLIIDLIHWIELSENRSERLFSQASSVRNKIEETLVQMNHDFNNIRSVDNQLKTIPFSPINQA